MTSTLPKILLIWPYGVNGAESIPMSMSFLVPQLVKVGNVTVLDCSLNNIHPASDKFVKFLEESHADIIGISSWSQNWRWVEKTILVIRDTLPNAKIVLGGPHVTATETVGKADYSLLGEAEYTFPQLAEAILNNASVEELNKIPGFRGIDKGNTSGPALIKDLDALGMPNFSAMFLSTYQDNGYKYRSGTIRQAPILATRGCPYECSFCEAPFLSGRKIRKHSIAYLKELLLHLKKDFNTTHINIVDDNFSFYPNYAIEFCEMVLSTPELKGNTFATPNGLRVERSNAEMFKMMKAAGWSRVIFAPESGSQRMVDIMAKHLDLNVIPDRVELAHQAGLEVEAFFILNYPGETEDDINETGKFLRNVPFDDISLHIFKPLPHTPIWRELIDGGKIPPDYVIGRYDEIDWLANGRTREDIHKIVSFYRANSARIGRVA